MRKLTGVLLALLLLAGVGAGAQDTEPDLKIALLPVLNTLPFYVAQAEGFFADEGVTVEIVPFDSARDQQVAVTAREVDGLNTDMVVAALLNNAVPVVIVRADPPAAPFFSIVAGRDSGVETVEDLKGVEIAIASNSIIEYMTTELLRGAGFRDDEMRYVEVPQIPVRLELLVQGQVKAATLPEPLTTLAVRLQGGRVVADDSAAAFVPTVIAFRQAVLDAKPEAVSALLRAYERAVAALNADAESFRDVLIANIRVPEPLQAAYPVPTFFPAAVPDAGQTALVLDWMVERGLLEAALDYDAFVTDAFLPETLAPVAAPEAD
ncbi:MAG: ABC transporter substrate-binding protein [Aggregatilineales bacterium]